MLERLSRKDPRRSRQPGGDLQCSYDSTMSKPRGLPERATELIHEIKRNYPDSDTSYSARAELDAWLAIAQERVASRLVWATWALVLATVGLIAATITLGLTGNGG